MSELTAFHQPTTLDEALTLISELGERGRPLAGGTALALSRPARIEALVDLGRVEELRAISSGADGVCVGAMATCAELWQAKLDPMPPRALIKAAASVGSRVLQNHVTVGGNCVGIYAWSDLPVALCCLGAEMVLRSIAGGERVVPALTFFAQHPSKVLKTGELLVQVRVPPQPEGSSSAYMKFTRNAGDQALASAAVWLRLQGGAVSEARLVAGALRALPQSLSRAAAALLGAEPTVGAMEAAGVAAADEARSGSDFKASAEYRKTLLAALVQDALELAVARAGGAA
jgi:aerobic carbon-monoxide dehydrogenase medium subunit